MRLSYFPRGSGFTFSAFPTKGGTIVIDPKRMSRIIELNEQDMYAVIEPYVSFLQVCRPLYSGLHPRYNLLLNIYQHLGENTF